MKRNSLRRCVEIGVLSQLTQLHALGGPVGQANLEHMLALLLCRSHRSILPYQRPYYGDVEVSVTMIRRQLRIGPSLSKTKPWRTTFTRKIHFRFFSSSCRYNEQITQQRYKVTLRYKKDQNSTRSVSSEHVSQPGSHQPDCQRYVQ